MTIPNYDNTDIKDQSRLAAIDFDNLLAAIKDNGIISGCSVAIKSPAALSVSVSSGSVFLNKTVLSITTQDVSLTGVPDATNPKFVLIYVDSGGVKKTNGAASSAPLPPDLPSDSIALATVYVPANAAAITSASQIIDKRILVIDNSTLLSLPFVTASSNPDLLSEQILQGGITAIDTGSKILLSNNLASNGGTANGTLVELKSGTSYTVPAGVTLIKELLMIGGGGGGGNGFLYNASGANGAPGTGGGGGALLYGRNIAVTAGSNLTYAIGAGGLVGQSGGNTTLQVGSYSLTAQGGGAGITNIDTSDISGSSSTLPNQYEQIQIQLSSTRVKYTQNNSLSETYLPPSTYDSRGKDGTGTNYSFSTATFNSFNSGANGTITSSNGWSYSSQLYNTVSSVAKTSVINIPNTSRWLICSVPSSTKASRIFLSDDDGITWQIVADLGVSIYSIAYFNNVYVAVGRDTSTNGIYNIPAIYTSEDGYSWILQSNPSGLPTNSYFNAVAGGQIVNGVNGFIAVGTSGIVYSSPNGVSWTSHTSGSGTTSPITAVAYSDTDKWVYVSNGAGIRTSPDGVTWTSRLTGTTIWSSVAYSASSGWAAVGNGGAIRTSPNGVTWSPRTSPVTSTLYTVVPSNGSGFTAVGGSTAATFVTSSADAITWTSTDTLTNNPIDVYLSVGIRSSRTIIVGYNNIGPMLPILINDASLSPNNRGDNGYAGSGGNGARRGFVGGKGGPGAGGGGSASFTNTTTFYGGNGGNGGANTGAGGGGGGWMNGIGGSGGSGYIAMILA